MRKNIFEIKQLRCSYDQHHVVLEVDYLEIPHGKLVVLLGKSGSGKSTFLETLGLMNNTILSGEINFYTPLRNAEKIEIRSLWDKSDSKSMSAIRSEHMSFIFQNTNLMPNFSALENICITRMMQGVDYNAAVSEALAHMQRVGIGNINDGRAAINLSGGQKQRVAFVRAITAAYDVLFGDEPTGNLDEFNTCELMEILRDIIQKEGKSAIIVSHNIDIALRFADQIIVISKNNNNGSGYILPKNILNRQLDENQPNKWTRSDMTTVEDPKLFIMKAMND